MTCIEITPEMEALKARLKATWMDGDYDRFSRYMEGDAAVFVERLQVPAGSHLLDVGCGSGQLALIAARNGARVIGVDIAPNLIERATERALSESLNVQFHVGDAEDLPFPDAQFDYVTSLIGAMFAPRPDLVAAELTRVCVPGGTIAMANWTPQGFIGKMFKTISGYIAPAGMPSPVLWGTESVVRERFGSNVASLDMTHHAYLFQYPFPPSEVVEFFASNYGPMKRAFAALNEAGRESLRSELEHLWSSNNTGTGGETRVHAEYLQVVAKR